MRFHTLARDVALMPYSRIFVLALLGSAAALGVSGCKTRAERDDLQSPPAIIYSKAQESLKEQDYQNAIRVLEQLATRFPFTTEGRQARLDLIYAYYKSRESESAIDAAETFIRENPTHPRIDYAWYVKGLVDFERTPNIVEKFFKVDLNERPPQTARKAFAAFRKVAEDFPQSAYAHDARRRMIYLRNRLADYELYVARYYVKRGAYVAAAQRAKLTIEQYDGAPAVREALEIMAKSYDALGMKLLADQTRSVYQDNYAGETQRVAPKKRHWWSMRRG